MRKKKFSCKLFLLTLTLMGFTHLMSAHSQSGNRSFAYTQVKNIIPPGAEKQLQSISAILSDARKAFDVDFIYESRILPDIRLSVNLEKYKTVEEFLTDLLQPYKLKYKKVLSKAYVIYSNNQEYKKLLALIKQKDDPEVTNINSGSAMLAPPVTVTGKITDQTKGTALEGVSVTVKGTTSGTVTGPDGTFKVNAPDKNAVLIVSLVGYVSQQIVVGNNTNLQISMVTQSLGLSEVVVIGYGTQKKSVVTGAISSVKASDLDNMAVSRIEQSLQGRTSGLTIAASSGQPGSSSTVRIRGTTSINNSDPLYIVDGVPVDVGGVDYLNQNDIESIEVLKDGASAAIYGTRAASGVILITTKKGKAGTMRVSYNGYYGTQAPDTKLKLLNAEEYATLRNESALAAGKPIVFQDPQSLGKGTDWQSLIFNNSAKITDHELSFSGGNDKSTYYSSFGYFDQQGIVATPISNYKRFTARFNADHKVTRWLTFGNNIGYSYIKSLGIGNTNSEFGGPLSSAINLDPVTPVVITDPTVASQNPYSNNPVIRNAAGQPYGISSIVGQEMTNPLAYIQTRLGNYGWSHNVVGNVYAEIQPIKGLKIRSSIGAKLAFYGSESFTPVFFLNSSTSNTLNSFYRENDKGLIWNWDNTISYSKKVGLHNFTALAGTGAQENSASGINVTYTGIPATTFKDASMNFSVPTANRLSGGWENQPYRLSSYFGRLTYDYDEKYLFTGILRVDGSTRFGSNNRYGKFPSVSVGWVPSRENFWPVNNTISFLKIRGSYGVNGNDQSLSDFQYVSTIGGGRDYTLGNGLQSGYSPNAPANPDLKWERTSQADVGFDATIFKNFFLTVDVYDKKTTGMILTVAIPGYTGAAGAPYGNVASLENKGAEVELGWNKKVGSVTINLKGNASYVKNNITNIGTNTFLSGQTFQASSYEISRTMVGHPIASFYGFEREGIFQTQGEIDNYVDKSGNEIQPNAKPGDFKWADLNHDGKITDSDRTFLGDPTPHWGFGFTASASWNNFDVIVFGQGVSGNRIFQGLRRLDIANANWTTAALNRWTGPGTSNDFPRLVDGDPNNNFTYPSSFYLSDGAYFRIKTLQVGYTLPVNFIRSIGLQKIRIYISSNNLITFTKYSGYDPEIGGGSYGVDRGVYPQARSFMAGLNVTF
jgi:TonB-dependent starch-binding outer membrane protein SusC